MSKNVIHFMFVRSCQLLIGKHWFD